MEARDLQRWCFHHHFQSCPSGWLLRVGEKLRCSGALSVCQPHRPHHHSPKAALHNQHLLHKSTPDVLPQGLFSYISGRPVSFAKKEPWGKVYWTKISTFFFLITSKWFPSWCLDQTAFCYDKRQLEWNIPMKHTCTSYGLLILIMMFFWMRVHDRWTTSWLPCTFGWLRQKHLPLSAGTQVCCLIISHVRDLQDPHHILLESVTIY